jgi:hypothetical protein
MLAALRLRDYGSPWRVVPISCPVTSISLVEIRKKEGRDPIAVLPWCLFENGEKTTKGLKGYRASRRFWPGLPDYEPLERYLYSFTHQHPSHL